MRASLPQLGALHLGSLPHVDPDQAFRLVTSSCSDLLGWPQLPKRTYQESMYAQFGERFPGAIIQNERVWVDRARDLSPGLEALYAAYLEDDLSYGQTSKDCARGLHTFLQKVPDLHPQPTWVKGQDR